MKKLHYFSGLILTVFIALHLSNHIYSLQGAEKHIEVMNMLRVFYRNIFFEIILLITVITQIGSGIKILGIRRKTVNTGIEKLQIWTGLYLAFFLIIHVTAVFTGRFYLNLDTNFYFGVAGLNTFPLNLFFIPYYGLAILSIFGHIASIHSSKMTNTFLGVSPSHQTKLILISGFSLTILIIYGLTNQFTGFSIPKEYILLGK